MEIYIKQGTKIFRLPVVPPSYEIESGADNQTETVNRLGEVNLIGKRTLKAVNISSLFPAHNYSFCKYANLLTPAESVDLIEDMKNSGAVQLIMTGSKNVNKMFTIDNFTWGEDDGSKDINYTIELKEYRYLKNNGSSRPSNEAASTTYKVVKGDTLPIVSKKTTGTTANWQKIKSDNNLKNNTLKVGQKLTIKV